MSFLGTSVPPLGPAAPVIESVLGSVAGVVGKGSAPAPSSVGDPGIRPALGSMHDAFSALFGQPQNPAVVFPLQPPAFGVGQIAINVDANPTQYLQVLQPPLQQLNGALQAAAQGSNPVTAAPAGSPNSIASGDFTYLDTMMSDVQKLMQSTNPSDQIKAQLEMNQFSTAVELITTLLAKQRDIESKIAQNLAK
jgi:hypothetical protein